MHEIRERRAARHDGAGLDAWAIHQIIHAHALRALPKASEIDAWSPGRYELELIDAEISLLGRITRLMKSPLDDDLLRPAAERLDELAALLAKVSRRAAP